MASYGLDTTDQRAGAAGLVASFATSLKASYIYPANNRRVVEAAEDLIGRVQARATAWQWTQLEVDEHGFLVDGEAVDLGGPMFGWLRDVLHDASLAGVELGPELDAAALDAFARGLRRAKSERLVEFETETDTAGLRPIALVFDGTHEDEAVDERGALARVRRFLLKSDSIRRKLKEVDHTLRNIATEKNAVPVLDRLNLLDELVAILPASALDDRGDVEDVVIETLNGLQREIARLSQTEFDSGVVQTALSVAKKFFSVRLDPSPVDSDTSPREQRRDGAIEDIVQELVAEYEALPPGGDLRLGTLAQTLVDPTVRAELVGVFLHTLTRAERPELCERLEHCVKLALQEPTEAVLRVVDEYVRDRRDGGLRVDVFLVRCGLASLLLQRGAVDSGVFAAAFPQGFLEFVDAIGSHGTRAELLWEVLARIGPRRLATGARTLLTDGMFTHKRLERLLGAGELALPLLAVVAAHSDAQVRTRVVKFLRDRAAPDAASAALHCVDPPSDLPPSYVSALCWRDTDGQGHDLVRVSSQILCDFVQRIRARPQLHGRLLEAIEALRMAPSDFAIALLTELAKAGRFSLSRRVRAVRRTAASVLRAVVRPEPKDTPRDEGDKP